MRFSVFASSAVAAIVGFGGTLALIIAAAQVLGATQAETASWVTAICLAIAASSAWLSIRYKMPIIAAWSTPGLALIGASAGFSMPEAVGAFIVTALALVATGLIRQLSVLVSRIPASVASGMLAGVLLSFVIAAAKTVPGDPVFVLPLVALFFVIRLFNPSLAVIAVLVIGMVFALVTGRSPALPAPEISTLTLIWPEFNMGAMIGLAIPLYLVTMASQNLPGFAVLRASGYEPPTSACLRVTGLFSLLTAPFGASTTNLAAISAALLHQSRRASRCRQALAHRPGLCRDLCGVCPFRGITCRDLRRIAGDTHRPCCRSGADRPFHQCDVIGAQG